MKYREKEFYIHEFLTPVEVSGHFLSLQLYEKAPGTLSQDAD
jgi:hypothetical protein